MTEPVLTYPQWLKALCLWREARGLEVEIRKAAMQAISWVIDNRAACSSRWPNSVTGVILQPKQFSSFNTGDPNAVRFPQPRNSADWAAWQDACEVAAMPGPDLTDGCNHYESCPDNQEPLWAKDPKFRVGPFEFYRL